MMNWDEFFVTAKNFIVKSVDQSNNPAVLTFIILAVGVAAGLAFVVAAIYFYRFCSNDHHDNMTKSVKMRTDLPPSLMQYSAATNPLYQHFLPANQHRDSEPKSVLLDLANDTKKIAQVFPLMNRPGVKIRQLSPTSDVVASLHYDMIASPKNFSGNTENVPFIFERPLSLCPPAPNFQKLSSSTLQPEEHERNPAYYNRSNSFNIAASNPASSYLEVQNNGNARAASAELLAPNIESDELRRASFGNSASATGYRRPGTGRKLPSTEHLERASKEKLCSHHELPQIIAPMDDDDLMTNPNKRRKSSILSRANAVDNSHTMISQKQHSSPLPQRTSKLYDRDHAFSRSWNADAYDENDYNYNPQIVIIDPPQSPRQYYQPNIQQAPPRPPPPPSSLLLTPQQAFSHHQAKSFDTGSPYSPRQNHYLTMDNRSMSEQVKNGYSRNPPPPVPSQHTEVFQQCHQLWQERQVLENHHSFHRLSTDFSDGLPSAASTSFESNTESIFPIEGAIQDKRPERQHNAELKRQQYKSLLHSRSSKNETIGKQPGPGAQSSFESDSTSGNKAVSSFDSCEVKKHTDFNTKHERHRSMMHLTRKSPSMQKQIASRTLSAKYVPAKSLTGGYVHAYASIDLQRDYSVDSRTDSIFRRFSRIDPVYDQVPKNHIQYPRNFNPNQRRRSPQVMQILSQYRSADNPYYR